MSNGIYQHDERGQHELSPNPDALNPRIISYAIRAALSEVNATQQDAENLLAWLTWLAVLLEGRASTLVTSILGGIYDGVDRYVKAGAPRTVPHIDAPDDPGEQAAF